MLALKQYWRRGVKLTSTIRITNDCTSSGPRSAELIIHGYGNEIECREAESILLGNDAAQTLLKRPTHLTTAKVRH
jgi:hypothetical protein